VPVVSQRKQGSGLSRQATMGRQGRRAVMGGVGTPAGMIKRLEFPERDTWHASWHSCIDSFRWPSQGRGIDCLGNA
jgi:hypothetical protein